MKLAIIGSRSIQHIDLSNYLPNNITEIISGGAIGVDRLAAHYARAHCISVLEIFPDYPTFGRIAPLIRNKEIVRRCDELIAFWDGKSKGTLFTIQYAKKLGKPIIVYRKNPQ